MAARPHWFLSEPDPRPGAYYTSARDGAKVAHLSGPFKWHHEALADINRVTSLCYAKFVIAPWCAYGTCHIEGPDSPRVIFNLER